MGLSSMRKAGDTIMEPGCYLDSHRGHYIVRDLIVMACDDWGYILDPVTRWVVDAYDNFNDDPSYPSECLIEITDDIIAWLNNGPNEGLERSIKGQNSPPLIPDGHHWDWWEGDFGLYADEED